jgi:uncharacterized protein with FMN-binding domain
LRKERITNGLSEGVRVTLDGIDLSTVPDGSYMGSYEFKRWSNTVVVHIRDRRITAIGIEKDISGAQATNASAEIFRRVIAALDTRVDAISGATVTSKAYLKAIEEAINNRG